MAMTNQTDAVEQSFVNRIREAKSTVAALCESVERLADNLVGHSGLDGHESPDFMPSRGIFGEVSHDAAAIIDMVASAEAALRRINSNLPAKPEKAQTQGIYQTTQAGVNDALSKQYANPLGGR